MFAIVVTLLGLCICAGSFKQFLGVHVQKPTANLVLIYGHSAKALASLMHICAVSPEPSLNVAKTLNARVELSLVQTAKDMQRLLRCLFSIENIAHEQCAIL